MTVLVSRISRSMITGLSETHHLCEDGGTFFVLRDGVRYQSKTQEMATTLEGALLSLENQGFFVAKQGHCTDFSWNQASVSYKSYRPVAYEGSHQNLDLPLATWNDRMDLRSISAIGAKQDTLLKIDGDPYAPIVFSDGSTQWIRFTSDDVLEVHARVAVEVDLGDSWLYQAALCWVPASNSALESGRFFSREKLTCFALDPESEISTEISQFLLRHQWIKPNQHGEVLEPWLGALENSWEQSAGVFSQSFDGETWRAGETSGRFLFSATNGLAEVFDSALDWEELETIDSSNGMQIQRNINSKDMFVKKSWEGEQSVEIGWTYLTLTGEKGVSIAICSDLFKPET